MCCVFVPYIFATVPPIEARRALPFAVYLEDYTCSVYFSVQIEPIEVTQEGVNTRFSSSFYMFCFPHRPLAVLPFIFYREKGSTAPVPRKPQSRIFLPTKLFSYKSISTAMHESEKRPTLAAEIRTQKVARRLTRLPTKPPGRRLLGP